MFKKVISIVLVLTTLVTIGSFSFTADASSQKRLDVKACNFSDVPGYHWAYKYISAAQDMGLVNGIGNNKFNPEGSIIFKDFVSVLKRIDRDDPSFYLSTGSTSKINRNVAVYQMWIHAGAPYADINNLSRYYDASGISKSYKVAWAWCVTNNIINGAPYNVDGRNVLKLNPCQYITRAEAAKVFLKFYFVTKASVRSIDIHTTQNRNTDTIATVTAKIGFDLRSNINDQKISPVVTVPFGARVYVISKINYYWSLCQYGNKVGFINNRYLSF